MTMTDPIADFLTRLRNANSAHHDEVTIPYSKLKSHIAEILQAEGYISGWTVEDARVGKNLVVSLKYGPNRERALVGIKRVSKPGLRVYTKSTNLPRCSAAWAWRSCPRPPVSSPTSRPPRRAWVGKSSPTSGKSETERKSSNVSNRQTPRPGPDRCGRQH